MTNEEKKAEMERLWGELTALAKADPFAFQVHIFDGPHTVKVEPAVVETDESLKMGVAFRGPEQGFNIVVDVDVLARALWLITQLAGDLGKAEIARKLAERDS